MLLFYRLLCLLQNVNVVKSFRQAVMMIQEVNEDFSVVHGVIVNQHDVLGLRLGNTISARMVE